MTSLADMYAALDARRTITVRRPAVPFAELPPATAPHGPGAGRRVALDLAAAGQHSHLVADGQTVCLSGGCNRPTTPGEVLL